MRVDGDLVHEEARELSMTAFLAHCNRIMTSEM